MPSNSAVRAVPFATPSIARLRGIVKAVTSINAGIDASTITVLTATPLETRAARRALPRARVEYVGIGLAHAREREWTGSVISCGLAGALRDGLPTGTVLVPQYVLRENGERLTCDPELTAALARAARAMGLEPCTEPMLTSRSIVRGAQRSDRQRGCASVDMETGYIRAARVAALRVVLDTPAHELSNAWFNPRTALLRFECWKQLPWLMREAPRAARRAAEVIARMLQGAA